MKIGDKVKLIALPVWLDQLPPRSQDMFRYCLNKVVVIEGIEGSLLILDVSHLVDSEFGGYKNDIRVEPIYVEECE